MAWLAEGALSSLLAIVLAIAFGEPRRRLRRIPDDRHHHVGHGLRHGLGHALRLVLGRLRSRAGAESLAHDQDRDHHEDDDGHGATDRQATRATIRRAWKARRRYWLALPGGLRLTLCDWRIREAHREPSRPPDHERVDGAADEVVLVRLAGGRRWPDRDDAAVRGVWNQEGVPGIQHPVVAR